MSVVVKPHQVQIGRIDGPIEYSLQKVAASNSLPHSQVTPDGVTLDAMLCRGASLPLPLSHSHTRSLSLTHTHSLSLSHTHTRSHTLSAASLKHSLLPLSHPLSPTRRSSPSLFLSSLVLSDTHVYESSIRALLGTASHFSCS